MKVKSTRKILISLLIIVFGVLCVVGVKSLVESNKSASDKKTGSNIESPIYIVYTNDVHSYIDNTVTDDKGNEKPGLRFSNVAALVKDMKNEGKNVILVDAGDQIQGNIYGAFDHGKSIMRLMNACNYQVSAVGNHEFDYGLDTLFERMGEANFSYIACNYHNSTGKNELQPSALININGVKVAFIGIITPETISSSTPTYFKNDKGEYFITFDGMNSKEDLYESVQKAIDDVKDDADVIIALSHTGIDYSENANSYDIIQNTTGLDAFIDGHSHTIVERDIVKDKNNRDVVYTQSGCYLGNIGIMEINKNGISTQLIDSYDNSDTEVAAIENEIIDKLQKEMGQKQAALNTSLYINDPSTPSRRIVRYSETNAGDFVADSVYWKFNNELKLDCDVAIVNSGGIRKQIEKGDITYSDIESVEPFGKMVCLTEASGQQILDALELGATEVGKLDKNTNLPAEKGGFLQVSGIKYSIDTSIEANVKVANDGSFLSVDGDYRVKDVSVYNKTTGKYEPLDLKKTYSVGGSVYLLREGGDGFSLFNKNKLITNNVGLDYVILRDYIKSFRQENGYPLVNTDNSPLSILKGFEIDYENPYGAGRINIK